MKAIFTHDGPADDRIFKNVVEIRTPEPGESSYDGDGGEVILLQLFEGSIDEFPVRGFDGYTIQVG